MKYENKKKEYYSHVRLDLLGLLKPNTNNLKVLEIGAGFGATLSYLKEQNIAKEVVGIDIPANENKSPFKNIDTFLYGDIEQLDLQQYKNHFDCIILADVLEHLKNPLEVLKKIKSLLNENGEILVSIPNFRHKKAIYKVFLKGDFSYEESGLFDYTHLRFFCKKNIEQLIINGGYDIQKINSSLKMYKKPSFSKTLNKLTLGLFEEFLTVQYLVSAKKTK